MAAMVQSSDAGSMTRALRIAVIGDFDPTLPPHVATNEASAHAAAHLEVDVDVDWVATSLLDLGLSRVEAADALWCAPGSPYRSLSGALAALRFGREHGIPTLGTCGGCQHMIIEYARNVLGFEDAHHAEYDPYHSRLFITPLSCSLAGQTMPVTFDPRSKAVELYGADRVEERYYCDFGLNPEYRQTIHDGGLRVVGVDDDDEARLFEIPEHPFYMAALFVPQSRSSWDLPHPLVTALVQAALRRRAATPQTDPNRVGDRAVPATSSTRFPTAAHVGVRH